MAVMVLLNDDAETLHALRAIRSMMELPIDLDASVADLVRVIWEGLAGAYGCAVPQVIDDPQVLAGALALVAAQPTGRPLLRAVAP